MTQDTQRNVELAKLAISVLNQIEGEMKAKGGRLPLGPEGPDTSAGETAESIIDAAVKAGIITPQTGAEVSWLMKLEMQDVDMERNSGGDLNLSDASMSRAAQAEQLVSSDIAVSRNTPIVESDP